MIKDTKKVVLVFLTLAGLGLRLWGIYYGLPHAYHPDEPFSVNMVLAMGYRMDLNPHYYIHPSLFFYLLGILYGVYFLVGGWLFGAWHNTHDFAIYVLRDPTNLYLIGRIFCAVLSAMAIPLIYKTGEELFNKRAGLFAAAAYTPLYIPVYFGHFIKLESLQILLTLISFLFMVRIFKRGKWKDYLLAGFFLGFSTAAKQPSLLLLLTLVTAHIGGRWNQLRWRALLDTKCFAALACVFFGFFMASPFLVLEWQNVLRDFSAIKFYGTSMALDSQHGVWAKWISDLIWEIGWSPLILFGVSGVYIVKKFARGAVFLLIFPVVHFVLFSLPGWKNVHWQVITLPFFCLALGAFFDRVISDSLGRRKWIAILLVSFAIVIFFADSLGKVIPYNLRLMRTDTRTMAKEWIEENIPAGSKIAMERGRFTARGAPPLKENAASLQRNYLGDDKALINEGYQIPSIQSYFRLLAEATQGMTYEITPILFDPFMGQSPFFKREVVKDLSQYDLEGIEYIILAKPKLVEGDKASGEKQMNSLEDSYRAPYRRFYQNLQNPRMASLLKEFIPTNNLGPSILIYRLNKKAFRETNVSTEV